LWATVFFVIIWAGGDDMNITKFIKSHKELNELPFLVVFRTIQVLREKGMLKGFDDVDRV
jgi:hypothetical protein